MLRSLLICFLVIAVEFLALVSSADAQRRSRPWPDVKLSTLPTIVGMANSWTFEINERSATYLSDLDKLHASFSLGMGGLKNNIDPPASSLTHYGYGFYNSLDYRLYDFELNIYSNLGEKTYGSLWIDYGKETDRTTKESILVSIPARLSLKTAFAWKFRENMTLAVAGSIDNWPRSPVFVLQPGKTNIAQFSLPADGGENMVGEIDLMYRTESGLDIIIGGIFQNLYTKFDAPDPPAGSGYRDTAEVKEYIYSSAPRISIKKTFKSGNYIRAGTAYYFNMFDYQYEGASQYRDPHIELPSYHPQKINSLTPKFKAFADGTMLLGENSALYLGGELGVYPNELLRKDTEFIPINLSLVKREYLMSGSITTEITAKLTRILHGMIGIDVKFYDRGQMPENLDDSFIYTSLKLGTTTRFYRNLWWSIRLPEFRLYSSETLGSSILFENQNYIETEVLFIGL